MCLWALLYSIRVNRVLKQVYRKCWSQGCSMHHANICARSRCFSSPRDRLIVNKNCGCWCVCVCAILNGCMVFVLVLITNHSERRLHRFMFSYEISINKLWTLYWKCFKSPVANKLRFELAGIVIWFILFEITKIVNTKKKYTSMLQFKNPFRKIRHFTQSL